VISISDTLLSLCTVHGGCSGHEASLAYVVVGVTDECACVSVCVRTLLESAEKKVGLRECVWVCGCVWLRKRGGR
jgi:hypothetical protein